MQSWEINNDKDFDWTTKDIREKWFLEAIEKYEEKVRQEKAKHTHVSSKVKNSIWN